MHSIHEVIAFLLQTTLIFKHSITLYKFKTLSELALIDIRNPFFTRKIKKLRQVSYKKKSVL